MRLQSKLKSLDVEIFFSMSGSMSSERFLVDYERKRGVYSRILVDYERFCVDYERFNKKWGHPAFVDVLIKSGFWFWRFLY